MIGVDTRCIKCHTPMRSCVFPPMCWSCRKKQEELYEKKKAVLLAANADKYKGENI